MSIKTQVEHFILKHKVFFLVIVCNQLLVGQNLIPDSSFENNLHIPTEFSAIGLSRSWNKASLGTSDLFCKCGRKQKKYSLVNVPNNPMGRQYPRSGSCYAGLFAFSHGSYREYLQTPLKTPLEKGKMYQFKMYVSLADYSRAAVDQLGVCFVTTQANFKTTNVLTRLKPVYLEIKTESRQDTASWQCLTSVYRATGEESYIIIGSFKVNEIQKTKVKAPKEVRSRINQISERDAYYFIDDVSLVEIADSSLSNQFDIAVEEKTIAPVDGLPVMPFVFGSVLFKTNEAKLSPESFSELNKVAEYLKTNQNISIEISGHTDSVGSAKINQRLSEERAKSVFEYLISQTIDRNRITCKGHGSSIPIATNSTNEGKMRNRRVEFSIK